tara:strand:+ start:176 stop:928 length:753 start_codon:yes stop_codon:yes gene_type:complete
MNKIFLFDVDGTLTPAKSKISPKFKDDFLKWAKQNDFYVVSGGSFVRIMEQLTRAIASEAIGIFPCMGNSYYENVTDNSWQLKYENSFDIIYKEKLFNQLDWIVKDSPFHIKTGRHYEERTGMLNFSIVGRNANMEQRKVYEEYDAHTKERQTIVKKLALKYPKLDFAIGGAVSIDIYEKGNDKSQIIKRALSDKLENNHMIFVGDRVAYPGNDYPLAKVLKEHPNGTVIGVESWRDTAEVLESDLFASS